MYLKFYLSNFMRLFHLYNVSQKYSQLFDS